MTAPEPVRRLDGKPQRWALAGWRWRPVAGVAVAWAVLVVVLAAAGVLISHASSVLSFDRHVTAYVVGHRTDTLTEVMKVLTWAGSWLAALALTAAVIVLSFRGRLAATLTMVILLGWLSEEAAVTITKNIVQRPRPPDAVRLVDTHGWSFPSGHTANSVVVFTAAALLVHGFTDRRALRLLSWALAVVAVTLVAFSRIELGAHWTTDVLASLAWTIGWLALLLAVLRRHQEPVARTGIQPAGAPR